MPRDRVVCRFVCPLRTRTASRDGGLLMTQMTTRSWQALPDTHYGEREYQENDQ